MNNSVYACLLVLGLTMGTIFAKVTEVGRSCLIMACSFVGAMAWFALAVWAGVRITWWT